MRRTGDFQDYIVKNGDCLEWIGAKDKDGYGRFKKAAYLVHRYAYEMTYGPIPKSLEIDHLCRNRACVNISHLEVVTHKENTLRGNTISAINKAKTHCPQGHQYTISNTYIYKGKSRACRICLRLRQRKYYQKITLNEEQ